MFHGKIGGTGLIMKLIAKGNTAEVFEYEGGKICKLFKSGYDEAAVDREILNTKVMNKTSVKTPRFIEKVQIDGRTGVIYSKVAGPTLLTELKNEMTPQKFASVLQEMSALQKQLHTHKSTECISYKEFLSYFGYNKLDLLPEGNTICHGDFHPDNIIRTANNDLFLIDFMNVCHGPKEYDIARTYVLITEFIQEPQARELAGNSYLNLMNVSLTDIEPFVEAVQFCRKREML